MPTLRTPSNATMRPPAGGFPEPVSARQLVRLRVSGNRPVLSRLVNPLGPALEHLLALDDLNKTFAHSYGKGSRQFLERTIEQTGYGLQISAADRARIPKTGPLIVIANHPLGAIDGILLAHLLLGIRDDVKVMANSMLARIPDLRELFIFVDNMTGEGAAAAVNSTPLRQSIRHLRAGGVLAVFPAGEVAHLSLRSGRVTDPAWNPTVARIVRMTESPVLPIFFDGQNSPLFQLAGLIHPRFRTALLPHELYRRPKRERQIAARIGSPIPFKRMRSFEDDATLTAHLRQRVFLLRHRAGGPAAVEGTERMQPTIQPIDPALLEAEIDRLPASCKMVGDGDYRIIAAGAVQIPQVLREIGRLREVTFRATGEGTGRPLDVDSFDDDYTHLFLWNVPMRQVVGAYRLGGSDKIVAHKGLKGLYTTTLFNYDAELLQKISPALELGRAFVRSEYQRAYQPLMMLWKGICAYCVQNPQYRHLFGPVSISNTYAIASKQLMIEFLKAHYSPTALAELVRARNPIKWVNKVKDDALTGAATTAADDLSDLVSELEFDQKGLPVLLRQYLKLGAKILAFNVDKTFGDCIDGLMVVDLLGVEPRMRERYMGKEGHARFMAYQRSAAGRPGAC